MKTLDLDTPVGRLVPHPIASEEFGLDYQKLRVAARRGQIRCLKIGSHFYFDRRDLQKAVLSNLFTEKAVL